MKKSFTLIELLVVIAIIGVLAALIIPSINNARTKARDAKRLEDLRQFSLALEMYYSDNNHYPIWEEGGGLSDSGNPLIIGTTSSPVFFTSQYMAKPTGLKDPLPSKYCYYYKSDSTGGNFKIAAYLEKDTEKALNDNGTASNYYEVYQGPTGSGSAIEIDNDTLAKAMPGYVPSWACGDTVTFTYKGGSVTYGTVEIDYGGGNVKCWLDRNLGASQKATTCCGETNPAYGDLFQWGRLDDGHQTRTSNTTTTLSLIDNPGHSNFIYGMGSPYDWRSSQNNDLWQGVSGTNNPCPSGWRVPTSTELDTERASWSSQDYNGAYASPLKLTAGGDRDSGTASLGSVGSGGYYWSSSISGTYASDLSFGGSSAAMGGDARADGFSVRCLKD